MKTSNKILLGVGIGILVVTILIPLITLRIAVGNYAKAAPQEAGGMTKEFQIKDFSGIRAEGHWELQIRQGETYHIGIEANEETINNLRVTKKHDILELALESEDAESLVRATITLPTLSNLDVEGLIMGQLTGFTAENFKLNATGHTTITGSDNTIRSLRVVGDGVLRLNLKENPVTNAALKYHGWVNIALTMAGGTLSGLIDGFGRVEYDGEVAADTLERNIWY